MALLQTGDSNGILLTHYQLSICTKGEAGMNRQHVERLLNHHAIPIVCANHLLFDVEGFSPKGLVNLVVEVEYARSGSYLCPVHSVRVVILGQRETNR